MYTRLNEDIKSAMKQKSPAVSFLRTIKSEVDARAKNDGNRQPTNDDVLATLKKFDKNIKETLKILSEQNKPIPEDLTTELGIVESYMPKQIGLKQLQTYILEKLEAYGCENASLGKVMKDLKQDFPGQIDMKIASKMLKDEIEKGA